MTETLPVRLLVAEGSDYEVGRAHGQAFVHLLKAMAEIVLPKSDQAFSVPRALLREHAREVEPSIPEYLVEEMHGIADGAEIDYIDVLTLNTFLDTGILYEAGHFCCTNFAILPEATATGHFYYGRNTDFKNALHLTPANCVICRKAGGGRKRSSVSIMYVGQVGVLTAVNDEAIAVSNVSSKCAKMSRRGIPMLAGARAAVDASASVDEAMQALAEFSYMCAYNFLVLDGKRASAGSLEVVPGDWAVVKPTKGWLAIGGMRRDSRLGVKQVVAPTDLIRQLRTLQLLADQEGRHTMETVRGILADRYDLLSQESRDLQRCICSHKTLHSLAADLTTGELNISLGFPPAPLRRYVKVMLEDVLALHAGTYLVTQRGFEELSQARFVADCIERLNDTYAGQPAI